MAWYSLGQQASGGYLQLSSPLPIPFQAHILLEIQFLICSHQMGGEDLKGKQTENQSTQKKKKKWLVPPALNNRSFITSAPRALIIKWIPQ